MTDDEKKAAAKLRKAEAEAKSAEQEAKLFTLLTQAAEAYAPVMNAHAKMLISSMEVQATFDKAKNEAKGALFEVQTTIITDIEGADDAKAIKAVTEKMDLLERLMNLTE